MIKINDFNANCGEILNSALSLENTLEFVISNYFCHPQNYKTFILGDVLVIPLTFDIKIDVFFKICEKELLLKNDFSRNKLTPEDINKDNQTKKHLNNIKKKIEYVQEIRNKIAHWERSASHDGIIKLQKKLSVKYVKDEIIINSDSVKKIQEEALIANKEIHSLFERIINKKQSEW